VGVDLVLLSPLEFASLHFAGAADENFVCVCNREWSKREQKAIIKPAAAIRLVDLIDDVESITAAHANPTAFWVPCTTFRPSARKPNDWFERKKVNAAEITAVYVDVDVGRDDSAMTADDALEIILNRCAIGRLPLPNFVTFSGRGLNLVYLLREEGDGQRRPVSATPDALRRHSRLVAALAEAVADLENDAGAARALVQPFKFCGTATGYGTRVRSYRLRDDGEFTSYRTLTELEAVVGTDWRRDRRAERSGRRTVRPRTNKGGAFAPWRARIRELQLLNSARNGIAEGQRSWFVLFFADARFRAFGRAGCADHIEQVIRDALQLNQTFRPPQRDDEVESRVRYALQYVLGGGRAAKSTHVALTLHVIRAEVDALGLRSILPPAVRDERERAHAEAKAAQQDKRDQCDRLLRLGVPQVEIVKQTGLSKGTVSYRAQRLRRTKDPADSMKFESSRELRKDYYT
jgi:hypothetical protein